MKTQEGAAVVHVQATENQRLLAATGCWEGDKGRTLPQSLQEEPTLPTPSCKTSASRTVRERISVALSHRVLWSPVTADTGN